MSLLSMSLLLFNPLSLCRILYTLAYYNKLLALNLHLSVFLEYNERIWGHAFVIPKHRASVFACLWR